MKQISSQMYADEMETIAKLVALADLGNAQRERIVRHATKLVNEIRSSAEPGLMEVFLAEYGLSTDEGIALMCLAEALLRVPDADTIDALIEDRSILKHPGHVCDLAGLPTTDVIIEGSLTNKQAGEVINCRNIPIIYGGTISCVRATA